jgi:hypothetical protein
MLTDLVPDQHGIQLLLLTQKVPRHFLSPSLSLSLSLTLSTTFHGALQTGKTQTFTPIIKSKFPLTHPLFQCKPIASHCPKPVFLKLCETSAR